MAWTPIIATQQTNSNEGRGKGVIIAIIVLLIFGLFFFLQFGYFSIFPNFMITILIGVILLIVGIGVAVATAASRNTNPYPYREKEAVKEYQRPIQENYAPDYHHGFNSNQRRVIAHYCSYCGCNLSKDSVYCPECGHKIE